MQEQDKNLFEQDIQCKDQQFRRRAIRRQMPNYWPAQKVPLLNVSYCHLIQGLFGVFFISVLAYVVFGLKKWTHLLCYYQSFMIKILKSFTLRGCNLVPNYFFSKSSSDSNKSDQIKNQNYLKSKIPINKQEHKQAKSKHIKELNFNNKKDLHFVIMSNIAFMGIIPFVPRMVVGICILNSGVILSRLGQQIKKYLLIINNNEVDSLGIFKPINEYLRTILIQMGWLSLQSLLLVFAPVEVSLFVNMLWIITSIWQKILPSYFYLSLIPLFISIVMTFFSQTITTFILDKSPSNT